MTSQRTLLMVVLSLVCSRAFAGDPEPAHLSPLPFSQPLSLADAINIALRQSPDIRRARQAFEVEQGIAIETRAIALPKLGIMGSYSAVEPSSVDRPPAEVPGFTFGSDQSWQAQVRLTQSLYEGGRILSSLRAARLIKERSLMTYRVAVANLVYEIQSAYYAVLLANELIRVQEASIQLLESELSDTLKRFEAGLVPRFNVLRAEVELANARPRLSRARNTLRTAQDVLLNVLALNPPGSQEAERQIALSGTLHAEPYEIDLSMALAAAYEKRDELAALRLDQFLRKEEITRARAGYRPSIQAYAGYDARTSVFSRDLTDELHGWMTGVQLRWDIFDGLLTRGRVRQAKAKHEIAAVELEDAGRDVELEVRTGHSNLLEAKEVLESQQKVIGQAEESLRLANTRAQAGTGTQLDVLSAQTALTESRSTYSQALHDYVLARARLERAMGTNIPGVSGP